MVVIHASHRGELFTRWQCETHCTLLTTFLPSGSNRYTSWRISGGRFKEFKCQGLFRGYRRREWKRSDLNKMVENGVRLQPKADTSFSRKQRITASPFVPIQSAAQALSDFGWLQISFRQGATRDSPGALSRLFLCTTSALTIR